MGIDNQMVIASDHNTTADINELLVQARRGDAEAFCQLLTPHETRLLRQAVLLCGNVATAEDLVSETLVEAWKSLARYNESCQLTTWLYAILIHRYQKYVRRARSRPIPLASLPLVEVEQQQTLQNNLPAREA